MEKRRKRAKTVQGMADTVAKVGQLSQPLATLRDLAMSLVTKHFHAIEERIFEEVVSYSLGGSSGALHWLPPLNQSEKFIHSQQKNSLLSTVISPQEFNKLPLKTQRFR
jgi:hypothetical protein